VFVQRLKTSCSRLGLAGSEVLLAVSGGPDSVALLRGCHEIREELALGLTVAHLNHQLRPTAAAEDAEFVTDLCQALGLDCALGSVDVAERAREARLSLEAAARQVRYEFFERIARERGCTSVAVAHTADDQAETILHHIVRGTGIAGLGGMRNQRELAEGIMLVRPLLQVRRRDVLAYLEELRQPYRIDASNSDPAHTRNRVRQSLLPLIEQEFNPQAVEALIRLGQQASEVAEAIDMLTAEVRRRAILDANDSVVRIDCQALAELPRHLLRECLKQIWLSQGWPVQRMGFEEWERLAELATADGTANLPHSVEAQRRGGLLVLWHE
jgi:tRNA(Ile)-lysidine synthase